MKNVFQKLNFISDIYLDMISNPDYITTKEGKSYREFRNLKYDSHVWSSIQQRKSGIICLDWKLISNDDKLKSFILSILNNLSVSRLISDILEAPLFGFQPHEIIWNYSSGFGFYIPVAFINQLQEYFTFDSNSVLKYFDKDGHVSDVPDYKIVLSQYEPSKQNPFGQSLLSKCYKPCNFKAMAVQSWVQYTQRYGLPFLICKDTINLKDSEKQTLADNLEELGTKRSMILPSGFDTEFLEPKGTSSKEIFNGLIAFCNTEISKAILSQTLTTELNIGSYAAANIHYKVKREVLEGDIRIVESSINKLIEYILTVNNLPGEITFNIVYTNADNKEQIERDERLIKMGFKLSPEYIQRTYQLSPSDLLP